MSLIHLARNNVILGRFAERDVAAGLQNGTYLPTDLAWRAGMATWLPLGEWSEFVAGDTPTPLTPETLSPKETGPAWENRAELGFFRAYVQTTGKVLLSPHETFATMKPTGGFGSPLLYYFCGMTATAFSSAAATWINPEPFAHWMDSPDSATDTTPFGHIHPGIQAIGSLASGMICAPAMLFIYAGILHVMLMLWRAAPKPFETTFRAYSYSSGAFSLILAAANLLMISAYTAPVAVLVMLGCVVWMIVNNMLALASAHRSPTGRVAGACLSPIFICCCAYMLLISLVIGIAGAGAISRHH